MVQQEIRSMFGPLYSQYAKQFGVNKTPTHTHDGVNTVRINESDLIRNIKYHSTLGSIEDETFTLKGLPNANRIDFNGYAINGLTTVTFTGTLSSGATSGTLSSAWTQSTGTYVAVFANTNVRNVTLTNGSTSASWTPGLSGSSSGSMRVLGESDGRSLATGIATFGRNYNLAADSAGDILDVSTISSGIPIGQSSNSMCFDSGGTQNSAGNDSIVSVFDTSGTEVAKMNIDNYDGKNIIITTTFEPGWYLIGTFVVT